MLAHALCGDARCFDAVSCTVRFSLTWCKNHGNLSGFAKVVAKKFTARVFMDTVPGAAK